MDINMQSPMPQPEHDDEGKMAKADLYKTAKYSLKLFKMMQDDAQLEGWVQAKITKAADYLASVYHYLEYEMKFTEYGRAIEDSEMYTESEKRILKKKLFEAKEKVKDLKKAQAEKLKAKEKKKVDESEDERGGDDDTKSDFNKITTSSGHTRHSRKTSRTKADKVLTGKVPKFPFGDHDETAARLHAMSSAPGRKVSPMDQLTKRKGMTDVDENIDSDEAGFYVVDEEGNVVDGPFDSKQGAYEQAAERGRMYDVKYMGDVIPTSKLIHKIIRVLSPDTKSDDITDPMDLEHYLRKNPLGRVFGSLPHHEQARVTDEVANYFYEKNGSHFQYKDFNEGKASKKAKKDYDGDGKVETGKDEVIGSRRKAAGLPFKEGAKPDFLDMDKDGNKKEPMKKAAANKKVREGSIQKGIWTDNPPSPGQPNVPPPMPDEGPTANIKKPAGKIPQGMTIDQAKQHPAYKTNPKFRAEVEKAEKFVAGLGGVKESAGKKCNRTAKGKSCPVHGMKECSGMMEAKPSAGMSKGEKSAVAKKAQAGKDIGKPGKSFDKVAKAAGGGEKGTKIAAAAMWKNQAK